MKSEKEEIIITCVFFFNCSVEKVMMPFLNISLWTGPERKEYTPEINFFFFFTKDDKEMKSLLNAVKYFSDDIDKHFRLGESAKVSFKK